MPPNLKSQLLDVKKMLRLILGTSIPLSLYPYVHPQY